MAKIQKYVVTIPIWQNDTDLKVGEVISPAVYASLGIMQDRVQIVQEEIADEVLNEVLAENPFLVLVEDGGEKNKVETKEPEPVEIETESEVETETESEQTTEDPASARSSFRSGRKVK